MRLWLRNIRKEKALIQKDISNKCGISNTFYANIELGKKNPSVKVAKDIAECLDFEWTRFYE